MCMLISGFSPAKELGTRANQKISGYNRIRVNGWKRFEYAACGHENFRIRKKKFAEKKISGYVRTWPYSIKFNTDSVQGNNSFCAWLVIGSFFLLHSFTPAGTISLIVCAIERISPSVLSAMVTEANCRDGVAFPWNKLSKLVKLLDLGVYVNHSTLPAKR